MGLLKKLKELSKKATKGKWFYNSYSAVQCLSKTAKWNHKLSLVPEDEKDHVILGICHSEQPEGFTGDDIGLVCEEAVWNMELIAELHNSIDTLIKVIELQREACLIGRSSARTLRDIALNEEDRDDADVDFKEIDEALQTTSKLLGESDEFPM